MKVELDFEPSGVTLVSPVSDAVFPAAAEIDSELGKRTFIIRLGGGLIYHVTAQKLRVTSSCVTPMRQGG
jgi:hypothetical protein